MQTHCPHCKTQFRVTEEQISVADGYVRCGICENVFNVFKVEQPADEEKRHGSQAAEKYDADDDISESCTTPDREPREFPEKGTIAAEDDADSFIENNTRSPENSTEDNFDFFNEEITESLHHVVPEKLRRKYAADKHSATSAVLWSFGSLLLVISLFFEYIWFHRDQYNQSAEMQAVIKILCQQINCSKVSMRDPMQIELIARNIYTHPNEKDALMVDVTMKNNARFSQPFPVMNISFADIRGNKVASRNFYPAEYLPAEQHHDDKNRQAWLLPDTNTSLTLEIRDPGKQATTYEFDFL